MHKHISALVNAGLLQPLSRTHPGIRLSAAPPVASPSIPLLGTVFAGQPGATFSQSEWLEVPGWLRSNAPCFVVQVDGDSMVEEGILHGDRIVVEKRERVRNGEIVVALVDGSEVTLKRFEQTADGLVVLHSANPARAPMRFSATRLEIQGVLVGLMRSYR